MDNSRILRSVPVAVLGSLLLGAAASWPWFHLWVYFIGHLWAPWTIRHWRLFAPDRPFLSHALMSSFDVLFSASYAFFVAAPCAYLCRHNSEAACAALVVGFTCACVIPPPRDHGLLLAFLSAPVFLSFLLGAALAFRAFAHPRTVPAGQ